ncbi:MAG: hypothetical protein ACNS62_07340 [Candidatus Cyclobacteriaceae bacterium M3_2C_046]
MKYFNFKRRNLLSGPHLLGPLLIFAGLFSIMSPLFLSSGNALEMVIGIGLGAIILGMVIISSYGGTLIDFTKNRYKEYFSIAGYKLGEWTTLPIILKVKVISTSYMSTNKPNGISPTFSGRVTVFRTFIYSNTATPVFSFMYSDRRKAVRHARTLASNFMADLVLHIPEKD